MLTKFMIFHRSYLNIDDSNSFQSGSEDWKDGTVGMMLLLHKADAESVLWHLSLSGIILEY